MDDAPDEEEIKFASPPCSLSELSPEFAGIAPRKKTAKGTKPDRNKRLPKQE